MKVAIVSGIGPGMGRDVSLRLAQAGADLVLAARSTERMKEVAAEIEAHFEAYRASGLALDHVNAHKHFHLHPTIAALVIAIGARYGLRGLRVPIEPAGVLAGIDDPRHPGKTHVGQRCSAGAHGGPACEVRTPCSGWPGQAR